jgi:GT2 family glycosyltransferase
MRPPRIAVCVLNWQQPDITIQCLEALAGLPELKDGGLEAQVLVVDNGSRDDSVARLRTHLGGRDGWQLLEAGDNLGYAGGNNLAIRFALERLGPDYCWVLNNDTLPRPGSLRALVECAAAEPEIGVWGSTLLEPDGETVQCAGGCYYFPWLGAERKVLRGLPLARLAEARPWRPLDYVCGAAMLVRSEVLRDTGGLDDSYFLYFEELELVRRLAGRWGIGWCRGSLVVHLEGGSTTLGAPQRRSPVTEYHADYSLLQYTARHHRGLFPLTLGLRFIIKGALFLVWRRRDLLVAMLRAHRDFFQGRGRCPPVASG